MLRRAVSRDEVSEGRLVILLVLFLVRRLVLFLVFLALLLGARDDDDGVGVPPGGDSSGSARGWREIADEARAARDGGGARRRPRGVRGSPRDRFGRRVGCCVARARRGMRGRLGRRANRRARCPRVAQRRRGCRDTSRGRRASADTRGGRARRARRSRARPLGEDLRGVRGRRGRCQSERRGAARRRRACRGFRWRETVVRSTPAVVRRDGAHRAGRRRVRGRAARTPRGHAP